MTMMMMLLKRTSFLIVHFSLGYACNRSSGIILIPWATFVPNFVSVLPSIVELAHEEKLHTRSITHPAYFCILKQSSSLFDAPGTEAFASESVTK